MPDKLIKGMDEEIWRQFSGFCKMKGVKLSDELKRALEDYLKNKVVFKK